MMTTADKENFLSAMQSAKQRDDAPVVAALTRIAVALEKLVPLAKEIADNVDTIAVSESC